MTSQKQIEANKVNAPQGGVKTEEGKAVSKFNAIKHGILQKSLTEYEEDLYPDILDDLTKELSPIGFLEGMLLERIAMGYLRLFRVAKVEKEYMESILRPRVTKSTMTSMDKFFKDFGGTDEVVQEGYYPKVKVEAVELLDKTIVRYEIAIERSIYKALHELQRLRAARQGEKVPVPLAIDVDVSKTED